MSAHGSSNSTGQNDPSLLIIILDTNPQAWAALQDTLPLSAAVANLLVFINAHLACNYANKIAVVASHSRHATWLYPTNPTSTTKTNHDLDGDTNMDTSSSSSPPESTQSNKYRPFLVVEQQLTKSLKQLFAQTTVEDISSSSNSTMMAGALTLALSHINRETIAHAETHGMSSIDAHNAGATSTVGGSNLPPPPGSNALSSTTVAGSAHNLTGLQSRILIISVSSATDSANQYIPIMNSIFACQRLHIPIDICKVSGDAVFLQQACDATRGVYVDVQHPRGFLQYLMLAFLPDQRARHHLILPTHVDVDFRAACFCHRNVVDVGFVCSICLSIFCEPPEGGECLTCGAHLTLGNYGYKPIVIARKKKKKKVGGKVLSGNGTPSSPATPTPMSTPAP
ncbi:RNA polymerase II transcription factor B subunit 4 [Myotisia sp. PD_48]|nr:RNA polymerase II transcription factor B subunit 4 [Myotisia sp. PD_48]